MKNNDNDGKRETETNKKNEELFPLEATVPQKQQATELRKELKVAKQLYLDNKETIGQVEAIINDYEQGLYPPYLAHSIMEEVVDILQTAKGNFQEMEEESIKGDDIKHDPSLARIKIQLDTFVQNELKELEEACKDDLPNIELQAHFANIPFLSDKKDWGKVASKINTTIDTLTKRGYKKEDISESIVGAISNVTERYEKSKIKQPKAFDTLLSELDNIVIASPSMNKKTMKEEKLPQAREKITRSPVTKTNEVKERKIHFSEQQPSYSNEKLLETVKILIKQANNNGLLSQNDMDTLQFLKNGMEKGVITNAEKMGTELVKFLEKEIEKHNKKDVSLSPRKGNISPRNNTNQPVIKSGNGNHQTGFSNGLKEVCGKLKFEDSKVGKHFEREIKNLVEKNERHK